MVHVRICVYIRCVCVRVGMSCVDLGQILFSNYLKYTTYSEEKLSFRRLVWDSDIHLEKIIKLSTV